MTSPNSFTAAENQTAVATLTATDPDTQTANLTWSIPAGAAGGADRGKFTLSSAGVLAFASARDFEDPDDANNDGDYQVTVQVSDGDQSASADLTVTLTNVNEAPTADAGGNQSTVRPGATVTLDGSGSSDPDAGDTLSYAWTQTGGDTVALTGATTATATFAAPSDADDSVTLIFSLRVTDAGSLYDEDTVSVRFLEAVPLTARFSSAPASHDGSTQFSVELHFSENVALNAMAFDNGLLTITGGRLEHVARLVRGSNLSWRIDIDPSGDADVTVTLPAGGACSANANPCTSDGRKIATPVSVTVTGPNRTPRVTSSTSLTAAENATAVATLTASDTDTLLASLAWSIPAGSAGGADAAQFTLSSAGVLAFASAKDYEAPDDADGDGDYEVTVNVSDGEHTGSADLTVALTNVNESPTAEAGQNQFAVQPSATVTLAGSGSDPDAGDTLSYAWTQTGGDTVTLTGATAATATFTAPAQVEGTPTLTFTLRVTDAGSLYHEDTVSVTLGGDAPEPPSITSSTTLTVAENQTAVATLEASDADTADADLTWSIPAGAAGGADAGAFTLSSAGILSFVSAKDFERPDDADRDGDYEVAVRVSDGQLSATSTMTVTLTNVNEAPTADAGADQPGILAGAAVTLAGSGTDPDASDTLAYAWTQTGGQTVTLAGAATATATFTAPAEADPSITLTFTLRVTDALGLYHEDTVTVTVTEPDPLTAEFRQVPAAHDSSTRFSVELHFSENVSLSSTAFGNGLLTITGGTLHSVERLTVGSNASWRIHIIPSGEADTTVTVPANQSCDRNRNACTSDGRPVSASVGVTVPFHLGTLALDLDPIAVDGTVNIAEKAAGFAISGVVGKSGTPLAGLSGIEVTVTVAATVLRATSAPLGLWSVNVPAGAAYIVEPGVDIEVTASGTGYTAPSPEDIRLEVDLSAPAATYTAPASLQVGATVADLAPDTTDTDIETYVATGLPPGLGIDPNTGVIGGTPTAANEVSADATVTMTDEAGNAGTADIAFPPVAKGAQELTGFAYSAASMMFGTSAPRVTRPNGGRTTLRYSASPETVCTVNASTGELTITGAGSCLITVTAEETDDYLGDSAEFALEVRPAGTLQLLVHPIAGDGAVNIEERAEGFAISGTTGTVDGVTVEVAIGDETLSAVSAHSDFATVWSVPIPANAPYIAGTSVDVVVTASKPGYTALPAVQITLGVDLTAPSVVYAAPISLQVGVAVTPLAPVTSHTDIETYTVTGQPPGLGIDEGTGVISGAPSTPNAAGADATVTVTDQAGNTGTAAIAFPAVTAGAIALNIDPVTEDGVVNIAERTAGFRISGDTGSEAGVRVSVSVGGETLRDTSADEDGTATWSVRIPPGAPYITDGSLDVRIVAEKTGFTALTRNLTLPVDLVAPTVAYTAPQSLKVGVAIQPMTPATSDTDIASYVSTNLPPGLEVDPENGVISGTPEEVHVFPSSVTIADRAGNSKSVDTLLPTVDKGEQTLSAFEYASASVTFGSSAPALSSTPAATVPFGSPGEVSYTASPGTVCTVDSADGALTIAGTGECVVTATAAETYHYNAATATFTVTVRAAETLELSVSPIAVDGTVNIEEKASGFDISGRVTLAGGDTAVDGASVRVAVASTVLNAASGADGQWSVNVPGGAAYISGVSVAVAVAASKQNHAPAPEVALTLAVDLVAPSATYTAPASLRVGAAVQALAPSTDHTDIEIFSATGLPPGLGIDEGTGLVTGSPDRVTDTPADAAVTMTDEAGNTGTASIAFPSVDKGAQTLSAFEYASASVTFGSAPPALTSAPAATVPIGTPGEVSYTASPATVCTVDPADGALAIAGIGQCVVKATAAGTDNYEEARATFTLTVRALGALALNLDTIAADGTVNIAEHRTGFAISGDTGSVGEADVTVTVGGTALTATSSAADPAAWSVRVPGNAAYISGASVDVSVSVSKTGYTAPGAVTSTLTVDLVAPTAPTYNATSSLTVGETIRNMNPSGGVDVEGYDASGLPSGLGINETTGAITGTPDTANANPTDATVTVSDAAGNTDSVDIVFPAVEKGEQSLSGFGYEAFSVTFGSDAPALTAPPATPGEVTYTALPANVCTVDSGTGALTIVGLGDCVVTATAAATDDYEEATARFTVSVLEAGTLELSLDAIAGDGTVNIAEKAAGFAISGRVTLAGGNTAVEGASVEVTVGSTVLRATSTADGQWSVDVPENAAYIAGEYVDLTAKATKAGYFDSFDVFESVSVDLAAPAVTYDAPTSLKVGETIAEMFPLGLLGNDTYSAEGLPAGLEIDELSGAITGAPESANDEGTTATVTVTDSAGNPGRVSIAFPAVDKGQQNLSAFDYSQSNVEYGSDTPELTLVPAASVPSGTPGAVSYTASPARVCTVDPTSGALTVIGVGTCEITATAAATDDYEAATANFTLTVGAAGSLVLRLDADIAGDGTVNIAEHLAGFAISGDTGIDADVDVAVTIGSTTLTTTSVDGGGTATWSVLVPGGAPYIAGTSVGVSVSASKAGYAPPDTVQETLTVDLTAPTAPTYSAPAALRVGEAIGDMNPSGGVDVEGYDASGLPSGLGINETTGVIAGTPDAADANPATATVTVTDAAGNPATVRIAFPAVAKGAQSLAAFAYEAPSVVFGSAAPGLTAPAATPGEVSYSASPATVCTVGAGTGLLTIIGLGDCVVTATAAGTDDYEEQTATFTVTVHALDTLALHLDTDIAGDGTVNIAERAAGFGISGHTGFQADVDVSVQIGSTTLTTTSSDDGAGTATWSVRVPGSAAYIAEPSVAVSVTASKTGYTAPGAVTSTLTVDLTAPTAPTYSAPAALRVGEAITAINPSGGVDVEGYDASGLPSGLGINETTGVIAGTPEAADANPAAATVTVTDAAGNPATVEVAFPAVDKGEQTLTGFAYASTLVAFGSEPPAPTAPTVATPTGAPGGALSYSATPSTVCTVNASTGALALVGVGDCVVTATAAATDDYGEQTAEFTVTVQSAGNLVLNVDAVAVDGTVNIAERTAGFAISGDTGGESGVDVSVEVGSTTLTATSADGGAGTATWSVRVPGSAAYIVEPSVAVGVSVSKDGFTAPTEVTLTLTVDLAAPTAPTYSAPAALRVGEAIADMDPSGGVDVEGYDASGLPSGLGINETTGVIAGTPEAADANPAAATVTVTDAAGNPATVEVAFPAVDKGEQTLTGFAYASTSVAFGSEPPAPTAPTVATPTGAPGGALSYSATPSTVCTVNASTGALALVGVGDCVVTATAAATDDYGEQTAEFTVTVQSAGNLVLNVDAVAVDGTVNIAERTAGFAISGDTGGESGVDVSVEVGSTTLTATSADGGAGTATWSVRVPGSAAYIVEPSVAVGVSVSKDGFTAPTEVTLTLTVDLAAPTAPTYSAPAALRVGEAIGDMNPSGGVDVEGYDASGLPSGLGINETTGVIAGTPEAADANPAAATVTVTDAAGNPATVEVAFPAVDKGEQTLTGFAYASTLVAFGSEPPAPTAPTVATPTGAPGGALSYSATPSTVCTVNASTGALALVGVGDCVVTATAAATDDYGEQTAEFTVTVQSAGNLVLNVDAVAVDGTVNIAERTAGFAISGDTGGESGVDVSVEVGSTTLTATSADGGAGTATWSVRVPGSAAYIVEPSVAVGVSVSKDGFTAPTEVTLTLTVDLAAPTAPTYSAPAALRVGEAIGDMNPSGGVDVEGYDASGLPSGLGINETTGVIAGTPEAADANPAAATVTVTDAAGNPATVEVAFPAVDKGEQTLTGFAYASTSVAFGSEPPQVTVPTVTVPTGVPGEIGYTTESAGVCAVEPSTGTLTITGVGDCVVTATAADTDDYEAASADFTVTVQAIATLVLNLDADIAGDGTVNIAEHQAGFAIAGDTGSVGEVEVTVTVGGTALAAMSSTDNPATWSVRVPGNAAYIVEPSVGVSVSASKTGYTAVEDVILTLTVDLTAPTAPGYTAPPSLRVGEVIADMVPSGGLDVETYDASGLPSGLGISGTSGAITGTPDAADANPAEATVTVTDAAGNPATAQVAFTAVDKGAQSLTGFAYGATSMAFGSAAPQVTAPTVTVPTGTPGEIGYTTGSAGVCAVDPISGALTITGVGDCVVTATAAETDDYEEQTADFTVTVQSAGDLVLNVDTIAGEGTVNIAERTAGFAISGNTGGEADVGVLVQIGSTTLSATSGDGGGTATWSVQVPGGAAYIVEPSVAVSVSASKIGFTAPAGVTLTLGVDLSAPTAPGYAVPSSLRVGEAIAAMIPAGGAGIDGYEAEGLPSGLEIGSQTGTITGVPDAADATGTNTTVTVSDEAGNSDAVLIAFPAVQKGAQSLTGFAYGATSVAFGSAAPQVTAPTVTVPTGTPGEIRYTASPATVCTVEPATGALTILGSGACVVTAAAAETDDYERQTATFRVTVRPAPARVVLTMSPASLPEQGGAARLTLRGTLEGPLPGVDTVVSVTVGQEQDPATGGTDYASVDGPTLTIPAGRRRGRASFMLTPIDDQIDEADESLTVVGMADIPGFTVDGVEVMISDDDDRGVEVSIASLRVPEGRGASYDLVLASQPTGPVTITPSVSGEANLTLRPETLTFTTEDWNEQQTVTTEAAVDDDASDAVGSLDHLVAGADYSSLEVPSVAVTVTDVDEPSSAVLLSVQPGIVAEDAGATLLTLTAQLDRAPLESNTEVTVSFGAVTDAAEEGTDYRAVDDLTLTIPAGEARAETVFTLEPINDVLGEPDEAITVSGTLDEEDLEVQATAIAIRDDDHSNNAPVFPETLPGALTVEENIAPGTLIGAPYAATDVDGHALGYELTGIDAERFLIDAESGQLSTLGALDHEQQARHSLTLVADDGHGGRAGFPLTVSVIDLAEQPGTPAVPTVLATPGTTTSLDLRWNQPDRGGGPDIVGYRVQYRESTAESWTTHRHVGTATRATIRGLAAATLHHARVRALNGETPGDWSETGEGGTGRPQNSAPKFSADLPTELSVDENTAAGMELGAPLGATDEDGDTPTYLLEGPDRRAFSINPGTGQLSTRAVLNHESKPSYSLRVRADDGKGGADRHDLMVCVADMDEQAAKPAVPLVLAARGTTDSLEVNWRAPDGNGGPTIAGYELQYRELTEGGEAVWVEHRHIGAGARAIIPWLSPSTTYEVQVRALNGETEGEWSEPGTGRTGEPANTPPAFGDGVPNELSVLENTPADIAVGEPFAAGDSDGDSLTYLLDGAARARFSIDPQSGQLRTRAALDHEAKADWSLIVRVYDGRGGVDETRVRILVGDVDERASALTPPVVLATADSTTSLDLYWRAPEANGGPAISGYQVEYRSATQGEWTIHPHEGTGTRTSIPELDAASLYQVRIRALNGEIPGDWSETSEGRTGDAENTAPVFDAGLATTLSVHENTAADTVLGAPFTATDSDGDTLIWLIEGADSDTFNIDPDSGQLRTYANLDHEARGSLSLIIKVSDGAGGADTLDVTILVADQDERPARPEHPWVLSGLGSETSLDVRWNLPDTNGGPDITGFEVHYRLAAEGEWIEHIHLGTDTRALITDLESQGTYEARVRALNGEMPSRWSEPGSGNTAPAENNAPEFADETTTRSLPEDSEPGDPVGTPVAATDIDRDRLVYFLGGEHAEDFEIDPHTAQIRTRAALDFEAGSTRLLRVTVNDGNGGEDMIDIVIELIDAQESQSELGPAAPTGVALGRTLSLDSANALRTTLSLSWNAPDSARHLSDDISWFEFRLGRYPESGGGLAPQAFQCAGNRAFEVDGWRRIPDSGPDGVNARAYSFDASALGCRMIEDTFELRAQVRAVVEAEDGTARMASAPSTEARMRDHAPRVLGVWLDAEDVGGLGPGDELVFSVAFTEPVRVMAGGGAAALEVRVGQTTLRVPFASATEPPAFRAYGSGHIGSRLHFHHTLGEDDEATGGIVVPRDAIILSGGASIRDATGPSGHAADLRNPETTIAEGVTVLASSSEASLTASFEPDSVPGGHDGETAFSMRVRIDESDRLDRSGDASTETSDGGSGEDASPELPGLDLGVDALLVTGGHATAVSRLVEGENHLWVLSIEPDSPADVSVSLGPTSDCADTGAVCTSDGRRLANNIHAVVKGPPMLSVSDARAAEAPDATMDFVVSLSRALSEAVSVDYATSDGSAKAGEDYTETSGTLSFEPGETGKTVSVPVLDDAHDDDGESFTLTLSNPLGGSATLADATATGVIENTDPMPKAWIARFGRTISDHVVNALQDRFRKGARESHLTIGGFALNGSAGEDGAHRTPLHPAPGQAWAGAVSDTPFGGDAWDDGAAPPASTPGLFGRDAMVSARQAGSPAQAPNIKELLMGSSFHYSSADASEDADTPGAARWSAWGRMAETRFSGEDGPLSLDGEVSTAMLGVDATWRRWMAGVVLAHSEGGGDYRHRSASGGSLTSRLTSVHPFARYEFSERASLWGMVGYGLGELSLTAAGARDSVGTDLGMAMAALGGRGVLSVRSGASGVFELALRSDAVLTRSESGQSENLLRASGETSRVRIVLEGSGSLPLGPGGVLTPTIEAGLRHDGGDAETGAGIELGGGLGYALGRLSLEVDARVLAAHQDSSHEEWGVSGSLHYRPRADGGGLNVRLGSGWGATGSGVQSMWTQSLPRAVPRGSADASGRRIEAEMAYGLPTDWRAGSLWTPFIAQRMTEAGDSVMSLGLRLESGERLRASIDISSRRGVDGLDEYSIGIEGRYRW